MATKIINSCALRRNAKKLAEIAKLIAVVKADAYGHGAAEAAAAIKNYASAYAVATECEARALLGAGISKDILILHPYAFPSIEAANVVYALSDPKRAAAFAGRRVAIKFNTGMNRFGADGEAAKTLVEKAVKYAAVHSVFTHLRNAGDGNITAAQYAEFERMTAGLNFPKHIASSGAIAEEEKRHTGIIRCGIALYGGASGCEYAMKIFAEIIETRRLTKGSGVGYGNFSTDRDVYAAVIDIGYSHGYRRLSSERHVYYGGKRRKVLAVCMDCSIIECDAYAKPGDAVEIMGEHISPQEISRSFGTNEYEVFTALGAKFECNYE